ncbi:hypothetical protein [Saccharothrix syringae]|uniref:AbiEi antitoxin C-terminal domain-containing protein n=1 Tax=Saccharothrix syringae TaxID=103733 RepID=A0A5Q0H9H3_SACSY|nr:hypothetical protein [Saccharothrix syringae]QFZ22593.1 hypothetical protein EKG83_38830 [Saccharothrix syringae]
MNTDRATIDLTALATLLPHRVTTTSDLLALGLTSEDLITRCRPRGLWRPLLPGVLLLSSAPPTRAQLVQAALRYAGAGAVLTGRDALQLHGMRVLTATGPVHVLADRQVESTSRVRVTRTRYPPVPELRGGFPVAPPARAAADAVRLLDRPDEIRAVLAEAVHRGGARVAELRLLLSRGPEPARQALAELARPPGSTGVVKPPGSTGSATPMTTPTRQRDRAGSDPTPTAVLGWRRDRTGSGPASTTALGWRRDRAVSDPAPTAALGWRRDRTVSDPALTTALDRQRDRAGGGLRLATARARPTRVGGLALAAVAGWRPD